MLPSLWANQIFNYNCGKRKQLNIWFLFSDKSFDLKYVIGQMLDPDYRSRPTADQVLAFPFVRKV